MSLLIQGAKAGDKPRTPTIAPDDHASISKVKILYALSEGEVKGLVDGAASILLDGTPLVDVNGNPNFDSVEWEIRHGTVDQTHIAGLPNLSSEIGINTPLRSGTPWVRSVVNTQLSSVNVNLSWSRLSHARDNGDVTGTAVHYAIDVQTDGGGYTTIIDKTIRAKTSGRYQRTHNVPLPDAQQGWQIRVRKITPDGDNTRLFNDMRVDSIAEIIDAKLRYPHTALLYLSFDARTFSSMPKIAVEMYGRYLKVPSNYDAATRTSTGIWDGTFKTAYTNNPAWVYYDLITNDRYGLGDRLKPFMINKWAIAHIARICDEPVDDGKGGTEPRFTCNLYLQKSEQAYQVLQHIAAIFRGMSFWNGSQIVLDADTPRDADYVITRANVVDGAFNKSGTAIDDRHTLVQVAWSNPANNYETDYVTVRNERAIAKYGINPLEMPIVGCTSEGQAYRAGLAALLSEQIRTQTVNFAMGLDGALPSVGSRVDIADMMFTGANNGGRISAVNADRTVITVDRDDVPATTGDRLTVNLESGRAQTREILSVSGRNITVKAPFDPVAPENVWAVDSDELPTMPFIVLSITENDDRTQYTYSALQYDAGLYPQIDNGTIIEPRPPAPPFNPYIIVAPDDVTIESRHQVNQGITVTTLIIVWDQVKDAVAYDVEWRKDDGDWIKLPRTGNISIEVDGVYSGNYLARVRAVSAFDAVSKPTTSTLTAIVGKAGTPPQLASLTATGLLFGMQIDWAFSAGSGDTAYTEIQVGSAPDVNVTTLGQFAYNTDTHTVTGLQGNLAQSYRGRIVDKLGNVSPWTPWVTGTTDANADKVMDLIQGQIDESSLNDILTSKIDDIAINKQSISDEVQDRIDAITNLDTAISDNATAISEEAQQRIDDILAANNAIDAERDARIDDVLEVNDKIEAEQQERTAGLLAANEGIATETTQRKAADVAINSRIDTVVSKTDSNTAAIQSEVTARTEADNALSTRVDAVAATSDDNSAAITSEVTARTTADSALSSRIDTVTAASDSNKAAIQAETESRADADAALSSRIDTITASSGDNEAAIQAEVVARADADNALGSRIDTVVTTANDNSAAITSESTARTNADTALSTRIDAAVSKADDNTAAIVSEQQTRADADTALTNSITALQSNVDDNTSSIATEQTARADADSSLSSRIDTVSAKTNDNTAAITAETTARTDADSAQVEQINVIKADYKPQYADKTKYADASRSAQWSYWKTVARDNYATNQRITVLQSDVADSNAQITQSLETLTTKDTALAASIEQLTATTGQNAAAINSEATARTTADSSLSSRIDTLSSKTDSNTSAITSESTARTNADTALSTRIDAAVSKADDNTAAIVSEQETRADADTALTNSITALQSTVDNNTASIATEQTARADADTALASDVTALQSTVGDNTAAISAEATTRANADTALSTRIDTVQSSTATAQSKADKAESDAAAAQTAATNAATLAGNKGEVIYQWQTPAAARQLPQNLWIDTTGGKNTPKRWDGSAWVVVTDKAATDAQTAANAAQSTANDALSKANTATSNIATIQTELSAVTNESSATASAVETLQTTVDGNTSSIQQSNEVVNGLSAQSTTVLDVNGHVIGVGTYNDGKTGTFAVRADEFYIASPSGDTTSTFVHYPSSVTINGTTIAAGTYLRGDVIATGSITGDKIRANTSITAPTINGGEININDNFIVDNAGNLLAKSGTFEGTVLANKISGTIDIATMKRSAWTAGYKLFIIKDFTAPRSTPSDFNSARQYSSLIPSYGGISWSAGSGGNTNEIAGAMFEIEIDVAEDTTVTQKAFVIDNLLRLYVNDDYIGLYNNAYPDSSSGGLISYNLVKGINKIQCILNNSGAECSLSLLGDFIDNQNVKFA
ncbi:TipJ family phage tail tip protein [Psychrobacter pacificensis]|uniref:TipJ family phage tail tip protein n=1 Tax=Psychrobacter pacificensis TaxID=112002 RepID=UPI001CBDEFA5|nr:phage tail protein [Psychrobacter pacificensis]MBZ1392305.1 phage tail protein [Psychrobacter pacificensis]